MPLIDPRIISGDISYLSELPKPKNGKGVGCTEKEVKYLHILYENDLKGLGKTKGQMMVEAGYSPKTAYNPLKKRSCALYYDALIKRDREKREARWDRMEKKIFDQADRALDRLEDLAINAESEQVRLGANKTPIELVVKIVKGSESPTVQISNSYEQIIFNAIRGMAEGANKLIDETNTIPATTSNIV